MKTITLSNKHIFYLTGEKLKDEFVQGITSILQGKEPQASCYIMKDIFYSLAHGQTPKSIPGIPEFDPTEIKKSELARYNLIQAGKVPSTGLDHSYSDLEFKPITTLEKGYLSNLYKDCRSRITQKQGSAEYRRFLSYLVEMMKHCADSSDL